MIVNETGDERIRVLIVDDHQVVRQGLRTFLELHEDITVVGEAGDGIAAVQMARELVPHVVLMDLVMPRLDGVSATAQIVGLGGGTRVIALTSFAEDGQVFPAIQAGASSYLLKDVSPDELIDAIRAAARGEPRLHPDVAKKLMDAMRPARDAGHQAATARSSAAGSAASPAVADLTDREREVIRAVAQGKSNQEIARQFFISEKTVKTHISHILAKLDLKDRTQLAIFAIRHDLADLSSPPSAEPGLREGGVAPLHVHGWPRIVLVAAYLAGFAVAARVLVAVEDMGLLPWNAGLLALFFILYSLVWIRPQLPAPLMHLILVIQCFVVIVILLLRPESDYATSFFPLLSYQAALVFEGRIRWAWIALLVVAVAASLMATLGLARGLGLGLTTMAVGVAFPALALASRDIEASRVQSRRILTELEATHRQLEDYAARVEDLAVIEERNRLARELHDSVSQAMFSVQLATRSAQIMLQKGPEGVETQLQQLQELTQNALARMRDFIAELRPKE